MREREGEREERERTTRCNAPGILSLSDGDGGRRQGEAEQELERLQACGSRIGANIEHVMDGSPDDRPAFFSFFFVLFWKILEKGEDFYPTFECCSQENLSLAAKKKKTMCMHPSLPLQLALPSRVYALSYS